MTSLSRQRAEWTLVGLLGRVDNRDESPLPRASGIEGDMNAKLLLPLVLLSVAQSASAQDSLRCGGKIVDLGSSLAAVLDLCGEPRSRSKTETPVMTRNFRGAVVETGTSVTERLIYDRGGGRFSAELEFEDGVLRRIEYLRDRN